jgi:hypothetical protein
MPGPYDGVHLFDFRYPPDVDGGGAPPAEIVEALSRLTNVKEGPVFFARELTPLSDGSFDFFAHTGRDSIDEHSDFLNYELWDAGVRTDTATELWYHRGLMQPMGVKRNSPRFCGIVRVRVNDRPRSAMIRIAKQEFEEQLPFVGASHVSGTWPLLVELGADTFEDLDGAINRLAGLEVVREIQASTTELDQTRG